MRWIYQISIYLYSYLIHIASLWNAKAQKWVKGRKNWKDSIPENAKKKQWIWFHCASLGEFEQGRPVLERIHKEFPHYAILLTFYSPSGFEIRKNYPIAEKVLYLPLDTPGNAKYFISAFNLKLVVFVKYELWIHFLTELFSRKIPVILISARMGKNSSFFNSFFAPLYRNVFLKLEVIFTQDSSTMKLIREFAPNASVLESGDTRFDRVLDNSEGFEPIPELSKFELFNHILIAGSTWPVDEEIIFEAYERIKAEFPVKLILAPHEINESRIDHWIQKYPEESITFSEIHTLTPKHNILWIDCIGLLSRIYAYGQISYVGGAWKQGLHNILEPTVFGLPVIFGPKYDKFPEAMDLIDLGSGWSVSSSNELYELWQKLLVNGKLRNNIKRKSIDYIHQGSGATLQIVKYCKEKGYLINE